ncbi:MAG TPA: tail fiber protein [Pyrinomonadaceae bacterium]
MSDPFLGEIRIISFSQAPKGWALCNGQLMQINQNQALFSLLGTMYGGNGQTTFGLPDFRGRVPVHVGSGYIQGQGGGEPTHTLTISELTAHIHVAQAYGQNGDTVVPTGNVVGTVNNLYAGFGGGGQTTLIPATIGNTGGSQAHENRQPYLALNFAIALIGIFPSRN